MFKIVFVFLIILYMLFLTIQTFDILNLLDTDKQFTEWPFAQQVFEYGQVQSPVDIPIQNDCYKNFTSLSYYNFWNDQSVLVYIRNDGLSLFIEAISDIYTGLINAHIEGGPLLHDTKYRFSRMRIYWDSNKEIGSENKINLQSFPIEIQMIHYNENYVSYSNATKYTDGICIISFFGEITDQDNEDLNYFISELTRIQQPGSNSYVSTFYEQFLWLQQVAQQCSYYTFPGSLTTSPYSQCAIWIVYNFKFAISQRQLEDFRFLIGIDNTNLMSVRGREIQPFNDRPLYFVCFQTSIVDTSFPSNENNLVDFPYVIRKHIYSEQSPINILTSNVKYFHLPLLKYNDSFKTVKITNNGYTVLMKLEPENFDNGPYISGGPLFDSMYIFEQIHFHWSENDLGSEHYVDGHQYAMEAHIKYYKKEYGSFNNAQNYGDGVCVITVFGEISANDNREMDNFISDLNLIAEPQSSIIRNYNLEFPWIPIYSLTQHYYTYHGSLTTPEYEECVIWIIIPKPLFVLSSQQLAEFRKLHSNEEGKFIVKNNRDLKPCNNRRIIYEY